MTPDGLICLCRANPGRVVCARISGRWERDRLVFLRWAGGGVQFWIPSWREWTEPQAEPKALEIMGPWHVHEARVMEDRDAPPHQ